MALKLCITLGEISQVSLKNGFGGSAVFIAGQKKTFQNTQLHKYAKNAKNATFLPQSIYAKVCNLCNLHIPPVTFHSC